MREPELGEMLMCHRCGMELKHIDNVWVTYFKMQSEREREALYDGEKDRFLSYDGCEHDEKEHRDPGIREEDRRYIRGTSYRPY